MQNSEGRFASMTAATILELPGRDEQRLTSILNNVTDVIWSLSLPNMNAIYVSPSAAEVYGRSAMEFVNNPQLWQEAVHPDDRHLTDETLVRLYDKGFAERECRIVRPDGSIAWISVRSKLIYDKDRVPTRIEGITSDITSRKQTEESLKERIAELEAIYAISSMLRSVETRDEMLTLLLGETLKHLDTEAGAVCLYDTDKSQLVFTATRGWLSGLEECFLKANEGLAAKVFASGEAQVSKECVKDLLPTHSQSIPEGWGAVCLPLMVKADIVGVFLVSVRLPREITPEEVKLLTSLAEMAGTAIHRIGLYGDSRRHLEQVQALHNIDMAIASNLDLGITYKVIMDEVTRLLNVDAVAILRLDPHTGVLKYEDWRGFRLVNPAELNLRLGVGLAGQVALQRKSISIANLRASEGEPKQTPLLQREGIRSYYAVPLINNGRVDGVLEIFHREPLGANKERLEFVENVARLTATAIQNAELLYELADTNLELIQAYDDTIMGWAHALDIRDHSTENHSKRTSEMTVNIARRMGMCQERLAHVRRGALLHDIGKIGVPDNILLNPGQLTVEDWAVMHQHPVSAFEMLAPIDYLRHAVNIPYCHHEKWDGTGYPRGLKREEIPLEARIFAVVDVYDALTSDRPYRKAWSEEVTLKYIRQESGKHFDPQVVSMFLEEVA